MSETKDFRSFPVQNLLMYWDGHRDFLSQWRHALSSLSGFSIELISDALIAYLNAREFSCPEDLVSAILLYTEISHLYGDYGIKPEFDPIQNGLAVQLFTEPFKYSVKESEEVSSDV